MVREDADSFIYTVVAYHFVPICHGQISAEAFPIRLLEVPYPSIDRRSGCRGDLE
jgi:hypothetical protein